MFYLADGRLLMNAALSALHVFEMFDGVGHVGVFPIDACGFESAIQKTSGRSDEGSTLQIFLIARLFSNQGKRGADSPLTKDGFMSAVDHRLGCRNHHVQLGQALGLMPLRFEIGEAFLHFGTVR